MPPPSIAQPTTPHPATTAGCFALWGRDEAADVCYDRAKARHILRISAESARVITRLTLWEEKDGKRICAAHDCRARLCAVCRQNRRGSEGVKKVLRQLAGIQWKMYKIVLVDQGK